MSLRFTLTALTLTAPLALLSVACGTGDNVDGNNGLGTTTGTVTGGDTTSGGTGTTTGTGGINVTTGTSGSAAGCGSELPVIFRDFQGAHEGGHMDFEISSYAVDTNGAAYKGWNDAGCGMVMPTLDAEFKPVMNGAQPQGAGDAVVGMGEFQRKVAGPGCWAENGYDPTLDCYVDSCVPWTFGSLPPEINSASGFAQWYRTTEGVNIEIAGSLPLIDNGDGTTVFDSNAFFPIDNEGFGLTTGQAHNYHFTTESHVKFTYEAGQVFTFRGDDDLWIFVSDLGGGNSQLALDLGGLHQALIGTVNFDLLGLTAGMEYEMHIFHAERQTDESNFRVQTNITCFEEVLVK